MMASLITKEVIMLNIPKTATIFLHGTPVDLRNGFEGLASFAYQEFRDKIPPEAYFVFINRRRTRIKVLHWSKQNLSIWYIRSRKNVFSPNSMLQTSITKSEFDLILKGRTPSYLICTENVS